MQDVSYAFGKTLPGAAYEEAISRVEGALQEQGFGILTRIDVRATLKEKIDVDFKPYHIARSTRTTALVCCSPATSS
jgi:uncharacterized protein (DUF302 family)